jgi:hypothetical protein
LSSRFLHKKKADSCLIGLFWNEAAAFHRSGNQTGKNHWKFPVRQYNFIFANKHVVFANKIIFPPINWRKPPIKSDFRQYRKKRFKIRAGRIELIALFRPALLFYDCESV